MSAFGKGMQPTVHVRSSDDAPQRYQAMCGAGYLWPSSIAFERDPHLRGESRPATCADCLALRELIAES